MTDSETATDEKPQAETEKPQPRKPHKTLTFWRGRGDTIANRSYGGVKVSRGQIMKLKGLKNDQKLIDLGYVEEMKVDPADIAKCSRCAAEFIDSMFLEDHYDNQSCVDDSEVAVSEPVTIGA